MERSRMSKKGCLYLSAPRKKNRGQNLMKWRNVKDKNFQPNEERDVNFCDNSTGLSLSAITSTPVQATQKLETFEFSGRRIVDIAYFIQQLQLLNTHSVFGCSLSDMKIISETRKGLNSGIKLKCAMCNLEKIIWTNVVSSSSSLGVNTAAVIGTIGIGTGYSNIEEFFSALNIPFMSSNTYAAEHELVSNAWEKCAVNEMREAMETEKELAIKRGDIDSDGTPLLTVIVDGTWSKRSYRSNYSSLSGAAAIVGYHTKKVLHLGVRNKYCSTCVAFNRKNDKSSQHECYKNWCGTSSAMEADIILEGFLLSMPLHGVKFATMIGDGDSNVYKKILDSRPYDNLTVEKIECKNHLLRNFCNRLKDIARNSRLGHIQLRKIVGSRIIRLRSAVSKASQYRRHEGPLQLRKDIMNAPRHVFGDHNDCDSYFCNRGNNDKNYIPQLNESGILFKIMEVINSLALHAKSLLYNANNNAVEEFNAIIAKHVGGKRINFALKRSYQTRCNISVVSHNSKRKYKKIHKILTNNSPGQFCKKREIRVANRKNSCANKKRGLKRALFPDESYGPNSEKPDMSDEEFKFKKSKFLNALTKNPGEIRELERKTILQRDSPLWREERRKLLTSSTFGLICNKLPHTSCKNIIKTLLYSNIDTPSMQYGRMYEREAIRKLESIDNISVLECGLFIDEQLNFLGTTPDGVLKEDNEYIVEIKCPASCANLFPNEAILQRKFTFWKTDKTKSTITEINKKHNYYFQVQGQLHITKKKYCIFTFWTPKGIKVEKIERDDNFWETEMEKKLNDFYFDCLLPEIIDPRHTRTMPIRDPPYIIEAIEKHKAKKLKTN